MSGLSTCERTDLIWMTARVSVTSNVSFFGPRRMVSLTVRVDFAAHLVDRVVEGHALDVRAVDGADEVAREDAGFRRRSVVDRSDDLDEAVLLHDLDAEAAEGAARLHLHVGEALGVHVARMRVERGEHAADRRLDHFLVVGLFDIISADFFENIAEQIEVAVDVGGGGHRRTASPHVRGGANRNSRSANGDAQQDQRCFAHYPRTLCVSAFVHHGPGSIAAPSLRNST